ncbi:uncharacterized protein A4U43_C06F6380 [Asparagus officinalis]|uniref:NmrA-like domain-containing protein n=1 Tax=Asparagus officinalis TaxID=4686 RepID=A0A5P1EP30_ASPOF|nr:probable pinoresinol-lariciresinol reductase 3 isoform X2 [Asparagus officinalis]ONK66311.1 uncharacterized protein A4U43_C06F6380 [Asparagus officinalis]
MEEDKSRILVIGATGRLGRELVKSSVDLGHRTFALIREPTFSDPNKSQLLQSFSLNGVTLLKGSLNDYSSLLDAVKRVDAVVCAVPSKHVLDQKLLIQAIKEAGCIKRFIPSEFGADPDKVQICNMDYGFYEKKAEIRRLIETEQIPYTFVSCNLLMRILLPSLVQPGVNSPPRDKLQIFGDGNTKAVFVKECDVAAYTISTIDDSRTLNKVLYLRPPGNVVSMNELAEMWESKIGKKLEKVYISEQHLLKTIQDTAYPSNMELIFIYSIFIKGDHTYFSIESCGLDGTELYPHVKHITVSKFLDTLL